MASRTETSDIDIAFVGAAAFHRICKDSGIKPILLRAVHSESPLQPPIVETTPGSTDISSVPKRYHEFADVFDEVQANVLPEH